MAELTGWDTVKSRIIQTERGRGREREGGRSLQVCFYNTLGFNYSIPAYTIKEGVSLPVCITLMVKHEQMS